MEHSPGENVKLKKITHCVDEVTLDHLNTIVRGKSPPIDLPQYNEFFFLSTLQTFAYMLIKQNNRVLSLKSALG